MTQRGRPPLQSNETILEAALASFAAIGYDATSVRALNAELGLSHETITQRFGTKAELFRAAVGHGLQQFITEFDAEIAARASGTDTERLRAVLRAFMVAASHHPNLGELLHQGGIHEPDRAELMSGIGFDARILEVASLLQRLHDASIIREMSVREVWFLVQAGAAPLHFHDLAAMFDPIDGPLDRERHIDRMVDVIMRGMGAGERHGDCADA
jgi:AcrR family transcriptional regulator